MVPQQLGELGERGGVLVEQRIGAREFPARGAVGGPLAQQLAQFPDAPVVVAGLEVGDLEVALRDLHLRVEFQRAHEGLHRLFVQPLVVVEHPEVVVRPRVRRIDPPGEGSQHVAIAFRSEGAGGHGARQLLRRRAPRAGSPGARPRRGAGGRSRAGARRGPSCRTSSPRRRPGRSRSRTAGTRS